MANRRRLQADEYTTRDPKIAIRDDPDVMVGATAERESEYIVFDLKNKMIQTRKLDMCPANLKLFKEIFSNATDNAATTIMHANQDVNGNLRPGGWQVPVIGDIDVHVTDRVIEITSRGDPIPIAPCRESTAEELILPPFRVFGTVYSGTNSNKSRLGLGAGKNGIGAKAANILSTQFSVEAGNNIDGQHFYCLWENNMNDVKDPQCLPGFAWDGSTWISQANPKNSYREENFVKISYIPDFARYKWTPYNYDKICLFAHIASSGAFASRVTVNFSYQLPGMSKPEKHVFKYDKVSDYLKTFIGGKKGPDASPKTNLGRMTHYEHMFWADSALMGQLRFRPEYTSIEQVPVDIQKLVANNPMCIEDFPMAEVYIYDMPNQGLGAISYVNGNETPHGGIHVKAIVDPILQLIRYKLQREKDKSINTALLYQHVTIICLFRLNQPAYGDQSKSCLDRYKEPKYRRGQLVYLADGQVDMVEKKTIALDKYDPNFFLKWKAMSEIELKFANQVVDAKKPDPNNRHPEVNKLDDANLASTDRGYLCTLFVTEGDAAKDYPTEMISLLPGGRDAYGVLPLRGKISNVCNMTRESFLKSILLGDLIKAIGLQEGVDYTKEHNVRTLRYGRLCCMKDADVDGNHINCLLTNFLSEKFPSFIQAGRFSYFETPIVRVERQVSEKMVGLPKVEILNRFYNEADFQEWRKKNLNLGRGIHVKYLKGLATSDKNDKKDDAKHGRFVVVHPGLGTYSRDVLHTAFGKKMSNVRKEWIYNFSIVQQCSPEIHRFDQYRDLHPPMDYPYVKGRKTAANKYSDLIETPLAMRNDYFRLVDNLINSDLIDYSISSLERAIPAIRDGLKRSQRQAMWAILERWNYGKGVEGKRDEPEKISRLASHITEKTNYKHGDVSMQMLLIKHCTEFTGGNNMALYLPAGSFGTRRHGGRDNGPSKARYTCTKTQKWHSLMMDRKMTSNIERYDEEGELVEPKMIPMLILECLINGRKGLGTGYCSFIPPHNPFDLIDWYLNRCDNMIDFNFPLPWYKGFTGQNILYNGDFRLSSVFYGPEEVQGEGTNEEREAFQETMEELSNGEFSDHAEDTEKGRDILESFLNKTTGQKVKSTGKYDLIERPDGSKDIHITEFPIGMYHDDYKKFIAKWLKEKIITTYIDGGESIKNKLGSGGDPSDLLGQDKKKKPPPKKGPGKVKDEEEDENKEDDGAKVNVFLLGVDITRLPPTYKDLHLETTINMTNMNLLNEKGYPVHFNNVGEIMNAHYTIMLEQFEVLRVSLIQEKHEEALMCQYKIILIKLIEEKKLGTHCDESQWRRTMLSHGIPEDKHNILLKIPIRILIKNDTTEIMDKIDRLNSEIEDLKRKQANDLYRERLLALREGLEGNYPKNENPTEIGSIAQIDGIPLKG